MSRLKLRTALSGSTSSGINAVAAQSILYFRSSDNSERRICTSSGVSRAAESLMRAIPWRAFGAFLRIASPALFPIIRSEPGRVSQIIYRASAALRYNDGDLLPVAPSRRDDASDLHAPRRRMLIFSRPHSSAPSRSIALYRVHAIHRPRDPVT